NAFRILQPLGGDVASVDVELRVVQKRPRDVLERLLLRVKFSPRRPPGIRDDSAMDLPESRPELVRRGPVPTEHQRAHPGGLGALDQERKIVPADVVSRDHVRVVLRDDPTEFLKDPAFVLVPDTERLPLPTAAFRDPADREDRPFPNRILDIERQY